MTNSNKTRKEECVHVGGKRTDIGGVGTISCDWRSSSLLAGLGFSRTTRERRMSCRRLVSEAGHVWYDTVLHAVPWTKRVRLGSAVYPDSKQPVDLGMYVQRHGGKFPAAEWIAIVGGSPRSPVHSEVWEEIRRQHQTSAPSGNAEARGIVVSIAEYVISLQSK